MIVNLSAVVRASVIWAVLCVSASAQSPADTLAAAAKLYENNDYTRAIDIYKVIPESAPVEIRLRKHTGLALAYINLGRYAEAPDEMALARRIAEEIGTDAAEVSVLNAEGQYLSRLGGTATATSGAAATASSTRCAKAVPGSLTGRTRTRS